MIQFGNNVSRKTETKTRRKWKPNVLSKSLYSVALKKKIKLRITANVLKTIDREGGLDEYLLKDSVQRIKELGPTGWALRWTLMQRPVVIDRLRAEAAALGLDQATIDKQWPTPEMLSQQKYADRVLAREAMAASKEAEDVEQGMWDPEEDAEQSEDFNATDNTIKETLQRSEAIAATRAYGEYVSAAKAAERYLSRAVVDSEEEGLKLAFIRAKERTERRKDLTTKFNEKHKHLFTAEHLAELKTRLNLPDTVKTYGLRKIAYNQWRREQINAAGGLEAWQEVQKAGRAEAVAQKRATVEALGGPEAVLASKRATCAKEIAEAETASTNEALDAETRQYLESAINKADRAIKAKSSGGAQEYVKLTLEEIKQASNPGLSELFQGASREKDAGGDAWAALVDSSNRPTESRPSV
jgi:large subunit ribosomal protein L28